jgi:uncharacterized protein
MGRYVKIAIIIALVLVVLFIVCGVAFNLVFKYVSYSFYKNAKPSTEVDNAVKKLEIGEHKELIGYVRSTDYSKAKKTVIYFGGSGEIAFNAVLTYGKVFTDYTFISVDYPGCQESQGSTNLKTMQTAAVKLYDYIINLDYVDKDNIYVIGYSYGTGMAAYLASQRESVGLVLVAPYRDVLDLYNAIIPVFHSPFQWFITDIIDTKEYAKAIKVKTLIITSDSDTTIKKSIPYALSNYFSNASVTEFTGMKHEEYWSYKEVKSTVLNFCQ